jgi:DNA-binding beta-propeller fold protein YncE
MRRRFAHVGFVALLALGACTRPNPSWRPVRPLDSSTEVGQDAASDPAPGAEREPDADPVDQESPPLDSEPTLDTDDPDAALPADVARQEGPPPDLGPPEVGPEAAPDLRPPVTCGNARRDVSSISGADGVAIGPDGTIYFTTDDMDHGWIGRMVGNTITPKWLRIDFARLTAGLTIDRTGTKLYVAGVSATAILMYDLAVDPIQGSNVVPDVTLVNDLAIAPDGSTIYFSRQSDRNVYRLRYGAAMPQVVTTTPIGAAAQDQAPAGLAFGPDGALYVGVRKGGSILRLVLDAQGGERMRAPVTGFSGWANGLAFDITGRLYVATYDDNVDAKVLRLPAGGGVATDLEGGDRFASMAFGRGTLDCHDLYIAVPSGPMRVRTVDLPGFYVAP